MPRRIPLVVVTVGYLALVAWATLGPVSWHPIGWEARYGVLTPSIWLDPATWTTGSITEFAMNIAMFIPLGVLFALLAGPRRWPLAVLAAAAVSLAIELIQIPIADRISDPRDLLSNTGGGAVGVLVVCVGWIVQAVARRLARRLARTTEFDRLLAAHEPVVAEPVGRR